MAAFKAKDVDIIDIRRETLDDSILETMMKCLNPDNGQQKTIPTLLLYDGKAEMSFWVDLTDNQQREGSDCSSRLPTWMNIISPTLKSRFYTSVLMMSLAACRREVD